MEIKLSRHAKRKAKLYKIPEKTILRILKGRELLEGDNEIIENIEGFTNQSIKCLAWQNIYVIVGDMKKQDGRYLSPTAQDALRERVIQAVQNGMSQVEAARVFGVSRQSVNKWCGWWQKKE